MLKSENWEKLNNALQEFSALWEAYKKAGEDVGIASRRAEERIAAEKARDADRLRLIDRAAEIGEYLPTGERNPAFAERDILLHKVYEMDIVERVALKSAKAAQQAIFPTIDQKYKEIREIKKALLEDVQQAVEATTCFNHTVEYRRVFPGQSWTT